MYECKGYNAWQFITEFTDRGWTKNSINMLLVTAAKVWNSRQAYGQQQTTQCLY